MYAIYRRCAINKIDPNNWIINLIGTITENADLVSLPKQKNEVLLYPNPVSNQLFIKNNSNVKALLFFDMNGKQIYKFQLEDGLNSISVKNLSKGTYIIRFGKFSQEIIIE